jgi:peptidoglycan biosynthesis protein MviN/MurJ (putative lipid II flippase)
MARFIRSFWEQEESYHSPNAGAQLPPHPKAHALAPPPNYGRAGLVMLAAIGVAVGAYLPWITYRIDDIAHHRTGYELGVAWGFVLAAAAFSIAAVLGARHRIMGWVTMAMSVVVSAMVAVRLLDVHGQVVRLNTGPTVSADVGIGLWIMLVAAAIGLIAAFRLDTPAEIV